MERERRSEIQISGIKGKGEAESLTVPVIIHPISDSSIKILWAIAHGPIEYKRDAYCM